MTETRITLSSSTRLADQTKDDQRRGTKQEQGWERKASVRSSRKIWSMEGKRDVRKELVVLR